MFYILLALLAHASNALTFVIDKSILGTRGRISNPAWYAAYSGLMSGGAAVLLLFSFASPTLFIIDWSLVAGGLWVAALWFFYIALKGGEASRIVPVTGSAVPLFTFLFAVTVLGEQLSGRHVAAVVLLVVGGIFLSIRLSGMKAIPWWVLGSALMCGLFFAAYFAVVKYMYDSAGPFLAIFAYTRIGVSIVALLLYTTLWASGQSSYRQTQKKAKAKAYTSTIALAFFGSKIVAMVSLILLNYAIKLGSVTVVNALQGTQYIFLLLLTAAVSFWLPRLFKEELHRVALMQKIAGILLVAVGLGLLI